MKASIIAAAAALLSVASAQYGNETTPSVTYTTEIVTAYETYCPYATEIVHGEMTYTVTEVSHPLLPFPLFPPHNPPHSIPSTLSEPPSLTTLPGHHLDNHQLPLHRLLPRDNLNRHILHVVRNRGPSTLHERYHPRRVPHLRCLELLGY
jgi:hypothetical protein